MEFFYYIAAYIFLIVLVPIITRLLFKAGVFYSPYTILFLVSVTIFISSIINQDWMWTLFSVVLYMHAALIWSKNQQIG